MEIIVNIPKNDYVQPTEVRQEVVQRICEAFLQGCLYHPSSDGMYRKAYTRVYSGRQYVTFSNKDGIRFNGAEMKAAFKALINAGYHMFCYYEYGTWKGYKCSKKPFIERGTEVFDFNDFID